MCFTSILMLLIASDKRRRCCVLPIVTIALVLSTYIEHVVSVPVVTANQWPTFPRRNIAALAREGYIKSMSRGSKRSISTLAKNGQLPTLRSPYDANDEQAQEEEESHEKRNMASIARMRSYSNSKRNIQALARDGFRTGRGQNTQQDDKRNLAALARNGLIHKRDEIGGDEYYYPFYQNPIPPVSEMDGPFDYNEMYDLQQSINPDMFPPLSQVYKRDMALADPRYYMNDEVDDWYWKRGSVGMPVHGLYRPNYVEPTRTKRYILSLPDVIDRDNIDPENVDIDEDKRSVDEDDEVRENFVKRHIGSLARLGLLPSFRFSGGRYSRSGRARLLLPSQEIDRKHSPDENFGIRKYFTGPQVEPAVDSDDADIPSPAIPPHSHPTGRILHRPLNNEVPDAHSFPAPLPPLSSANYIESLSRNRWQSNKEIPRFNYFRTSKVPYQSKRYLLIPAVDNIMLRKNLYRNSSLPSRRKNQ